MTIRPYTHNDFKMIQSWHKESPEKEQLPLESSFILEKNDVPVVCISVFLTNTNICYMENMIANPEIKDRKDATKAIMEHAWNFAKDKGYKYAVGFTKHESLAKRHLQMGWQKKFNNIIILGQEL